jgi:hypothetical protein
MNWKDYEKEIFEALRVAYRGSAILFNQKLMGRYSKTQRQVDILIESYIAGKKIRLVFDGKFFNKKIDVKEVESFISMVEDLDAKQGVLITSVGYTQAAINRAYYGPVDIELDILNFNPLTSFQVTTGFINWGKYGVAIPSPFGWVMDSSEQKGVQATFYQRGLTLEEAAIAKEWMYVNIFVKDEKVQNIDDLVSLQEKNIKEFHPNASFDYESSIQREDGAKTLLRTVVIDKYPTNEYTGFVEFKEFLLFFVMFTPIELKGKNLRKLETVLQNSTPVTIDTLSLLKARLLELEEILLKTSDRAERAEILIQQGDINTSLKLYEEGIKKYNESILMLKTSYGALKGKIKIGLLIKLNCEEIASYVNDFFDLDPTNPTVCKDMVDLFKRHNRVRDLIYFLKHGATKFSSNQEAVGNFNYHLGVLYFTLNKNKEAKRYLLLAKVAFAKSLPPKHYVFEVIRKQLKEINN